MKIYFVERGSYSDYSVVGVYSTLALAERAKALYCADEITERELDAMPVAPEGMLLYSVVMDQNGRVMFGHDVPQSAESAALYLKDEWRPYSDGVFVCFYMWADSSESAVKIANEKRTRLIAENRWNADWNLWKASRK